MLKSYHFFFLPQLLFLLSASDFFFFFSLLYVVIVNKNSFKFFLLPQLQFFIWTFLYCLIVFLSFSQSFIVHYHRDSFCPTGLNKKLKLERREQRSVHLEHRHHLSHQTPKFQFYEAFQVLHFFSNMLIKRHSSKISKIKIPFFFQPCEPSLFLFMVYSLTLSLPSHMSTF